MCDQADAHFPVIISGVNVITENGTAMSVHLATGHDLCPVGLLCCEVTIGKSQFKHTCIVCKNLQK